MKALHRIIAQARAVPKHIVLCEGGDARVLQAAARAAAEGLAHITIVGNPAAILALAQEHALNLDAVRLVDPAESSESEHYAQQLFVLRQAKGMTVEQARNARADPLFYATDGAPGRRGRLRVGAGTRRRTWCAAHPDIGVDRPSARVELFPVMLCNLLQLRRSSFPTALWWSTESRDWPHRLAAADSPTLLMEDRGAMLSFPPAAAPTTRRRQVMRNRPGQAQRPRLAIVATCSSMRPSCPRFPAQGQGFRRQRPREVWFPT